MLTRVAIHLWYVLSFIQNARKCAVHLWYVYVFIHNARKCGHSENTCARVLAFIQMLARVTIHSLICFVFIQDTRICDSSFIFVFIQMFPRVCTVRMHAVNFTYLFNMLAHETVYEVSGYYTWACLTKNAIQNCYVNI